jgi:streptogramin lyase
MTTSHAVSTPSHPLARTVNLLCVLIAGFAAIFVVIAPTAGATPGTVTPAGSPGTVTHYTDPSVSSPYGIAEGPDGAMWFANQVTNSIGRIAPDGTITHYTAPSIDSPGQITAGPDGAMWFTNQNGNTIGRITMSGAVSAFPDPNIYNPVGITAGPDGALWFTMDSGFPEIGRITTSGAVTTWRDPSGSNQSPDGIVSGPDGNLWFVNSYPASIGKITPSGVITEYTNPQLNFPVGIAAGADGNLWFTDRGGNQIGRITPAGNFHLYSDSTTVSPSAIAAGQDGALWFTNFGSGAIGRITTAGTLSNFSAGHPGLGIAQGSGDTMWFTEYNNAIGRISTQAAIPTVTGVSPSHGSVDGGGSVTVTGTGLSDVTSVSFGATPATTFAPNGDGTALTVTPPVHALGTVNIRVADPGGTSVVSPADRYAYLANQPAPTVTGVSPPHGLVDGGETVTVTGTGFSDATSVNFGAVKATVFTSNGDGTQLTVTPPAHAFGTVNVKVSGPGGASAVTSADQYTYFADEPTPTVTGVSPASGSAAGGETVTVTGAGFNDATAVSFGGAKASDFSSNLGGTQLTVTTPAHAVGAANIRVSGPGGKSDLSAADRYRFTA